MFSSNVRSESVCDQKLIHIRDRAKSKDGQLLKAHAAVHCNKLWQITASHSISQHLLATLRVSYLASALGASVSVRVKAYEWNALNAVYKATVLNTYCSVSVTKYSAHEPYSVLLSETKWDYWQESESITDHADHISCKLRLITYERCNFELATLWTMCQTEVWAKLWGSIQWRTMYIPAIVIYNFPNLPVRLPHFRRAPKQTRVWINYALS